MIKEERELEDNRENYIDNFKNNLTKKNLYQTIHFLENYF